MATEQFALEAAISRVETELRRSAREETTLSSSSLSFISRVEEFVRSAREKLDLNISNIRNRLRLGKTTKVVPTKAEIAERLAQGLAFVPRTQLKAKNIGRRISSLNRKETTALIVLILAAWVAGYFSPSNRASENAAQEKKQQETQNNRSDSRGQAKNLLPIRARTMVQ